MRPKGTSAELERRRRLAVDLITQGEAPAVVAGALGVTRVTLSRWLARAALPQGLAARPHQGPRRRLSDTHLAELKAILRAVPVVPGRPYPAWSVRRVTSLIQRRFGVAYHPEHVRKLLKQALGSAETPPAHEETRAG